MYNSQTTMNRLAESGKTHIKVGDNVQFVIDENTKNFKIRIPNIWMKYPLYQAHDFDSFLAKKCIETHVSEINGVKYRTIKFLKNGIYEIGNATSSNVQPVPMIITDGFYSIHVRSRTFYEWLVGTIIS